MHAGRESAASLFILFQVYEMFRCFKTSVSPERAIRQMREVEGVLHDMVVKYERLRRLAKTSFAQESKKSRKMIHLKKIKTLDHYIQHCENKISVCVQKQYALEQLEVTKLQVEAIRASTSVFKRWSKYNPIDKIEDLQDTMEEQFAELADITGLLEQSSLQFDEDELMAELAQMETDEQMQEELPQVPSVPIPRVDGGSRHIAVMV